MPTTKIHPKYDSFMKIGGLTPPPPTPMYPLNLSRFVIARPFKAEAIQEFGAERVVVSQTLDAGLVGLRPPSGRYRSQ